MTSQWLQEKKCKSTDAEMFFFGINDSEVGVAPIGFMQYRSHGLNN